MDGLAHLFPQQMQAQTLNHPLLQKYDLQLDVLRLDQLHPIISGNKWFKLKPHLQVAIQQGKQKLVTVGGAFSNHVAATAFACQQIGLPSVAIIRGEAPLELSPTLQAAQSQGMQLHFVDRNSFANLKRSGAHPLINAATDHFVPEGGFGPMAMQGAKDILNNLQNAAKYDVITCSIGTGTTFAGMVAAAQAHQQVLGFSSMKNNHSLVDEVVALLANEPEQVPWQINPNFHFGGFAKHQPPLLQFMNEWFAQTGMPTDFVYTGKLFFGLMHLVERGYFASGTKILAIHTGGLQGNAGLPAGSLRF
jgi:1-aminocyclopropane-1-carboxylate deaminase